MLGSVLGRLKSQQRTGKEGGQKMKKLLIVFLLVLILAMPVGVAMAVMATHDSNLSESVPTDNAAEKSVKLLKNTAIIVKMDHSTLVTKQGTYSLTGVDVVYRKAPWKSESAKNKKGKSGKSVAEMTFFDGTLKHVIIYQ